MALILVTGASTGLGLATATALAGAGHDVVLHARNPDRLDDPAVLDRMHAAFYADLAQLTDTIRLAERLNSLGRFDAVIHNAGVLHGRDVLAVNTIAPYTLTSLMLRPRRWIALSSGMHQSGSPDLKHSELGGGPRTSYQDSKLYVTALTLALARRWPDMLAHAVDPGWVPTRKGGPSAPDDLDAGHRTQGWLATANEPEISPRTGGYWHHRTPRSPHPAAADPQFQATLIGALEARTGTTLPPA